MEELNRSNIAQVAPTIVRSGPHTTPINLQFANLEDDLQQALKDWHDNSYKAGSLAYLLLYKNALHNPSRTPRQATNHILTKALNTLKSTHEADFEFLNMRFVEAQKMRYIAERFNVADSTTYVLQRSAVRALVNIVQEMELEERVAQQKRLRERLDTASYVKLIGVEPHLEELLAVLNAPEPPWIISIEGIGGIGKTSLAHNLTHQVINQCTFDQIGWVSGRQKHLDLVGGIGTVRGPTITAELLVDDLIRQLMPEYTTVITYPFERKISIIEAYLEESRHLVIIDNLETVVDIQALLPTLDRLANPTKFVMTSRTRWYNHPNLYHFVVPPLDEDNALKLIRQEARYGNIVGLDTCGDDELRPIYETAGGNPLALRLVAGQVHIHPLDTVLRNLTEARGETVENLYTFIYRQAWDNLNELGQRVFLIMPLICEAGIDFDYIAGASGIQVDDLRTSLHDLTKLSLVDVYGKPKERRYTIHNLTRTFLKDQVIKWQ